MAKLTDFLQARNSEVDAGSPAIASHFLIQQEAIASRREREIETEIALEASIEVICLKSTRPHTYNCIYIAE
jgi:hypothetical protein